MLEGARRRVGLVLSRNFILLVLFALVFFILYFWRLGNLTAGLSPAEVYAHDSSSTFSAIFSNPLNLPHKILQHVSIGFKDNSLFLRLPSAIFGVGFLTCLYLLLRSWFGRVVGLLAALMFISTPWIILLARTASPDIMFFSPIIIFLAYSWLIRTRNNQQLAWFALVLAVATCLYTPGLVWVLSVFVIFGAKHLIKAASGVKKSTHFLSVFTLLLLLSPLIRAFIISPSLINAWLLIPSYWPPIIETLKSIVWSLLGLFLRLRQPVDVSIGRLPVINLAEVALIIFGVYALISRLRRVLYIIAALVFVAVLLAGINRNMLIVTLALPAVALVITAGLRFLYIEWMSIFPRNPIPKFFALFLIGSVVVAHLYLGYHFSLTAWPNTKNTRETYVLK